MFTASSGDGPDFNGARSRPEPEPPRMAPRHPLPASRMFPCLQIMLDFFGASLHVLQYVAIIGESVIQHRWRIERTLIALFKLAGFVSQDETMIVAVS